MFEGHSLGVMNHAKKLIAINPDEPIFSNLVDYGKTLKSKYSILVTDATDQLADAANWIRLASLVFTASYLELYVRRVVAASIHSDPGVLIRTPRAVDGVKFLKAKALTIADATVEACTKGKWSARHHALKELFSNDIPGIHANLSELDSLQSTRNAIAHHFARLSAGNARSASDDFWYLDPAHAERQPIVKVSTERMVKLFKAAQGATLELEALAAPHIGAFETIRFWHTFNTVRTDPKSKVYDGYQSLFKSGGKQKLISTFHAKMAGSTLSREYCRDLISYYDAM